MVHITRGKRIISRNEVIISFPREIITITRSSKDSMFFLFWVFCKIGKSHFLLDNISTHLLCGHYDVEIWIRKCWSEQVLICSRSAKFSLWQHWFQALIPVAICGHYYMLPGMGGDYISQRKDFITIEIDKKCNKVEYTSV